MGQDRRRESLERSRDERLSCVSVSAQVGESSCSPARWNHPPSSFPQAQVSSVTLSHAALACVAVALPADLSAFQFFDRVLLLSQKLYSLQVKEGGAITPAVCLQMFVDDLSILRPSSRSGTATWSCSGPPCRGATKETGSWSRRSSARWPCKGKSWPPSTRCSLSTARSSSAGRGRGRGTGSRWRPPRPGSIRGRRSADGWR